MGTEVFSFGFSESHPLSESSPCISHSKMLPLDQPTRASQTTRLECVRHSRRPKSERLDPVSLLHFFPKSTFSSEPETRGLDSENGLERSTFVIYLMPFAGKYYTLYIWYSDKKHYQFTPSPPVLQQRTHKVTLRSKALERALPDTEAPRQACLHSSWERLAVSSAHLTSGLTDPWLPASPSCAWFWSLLLVHSTQRGPGQFGPPGRQAAVDPLPTAPSTPALHPGRSGSSSISFLRFPTQTSFCRLCFLFRREFCSLTGRWLTVLSPEHLFLELAGLGCNRCSEKGNYTAVRVLWNPIQYISKLFLQTCRSSIKFISLIHNPGISISLKSVY